jgi:RNA polymerase sigma-70 factor (ECF subfamily)
MSPPPADLEIHRAALTGHCYRMLGSAVDADDAVQDTMMRALRALDQFDGRASLKTWLYRIATNVCLDALGDRKRRARPLEEGPMGSCDAHLETRPREHWLEPVSDARAIPVDATPAEKTELRQSIRLAFVAALQHLPAKQRAALILAEVLGWSVADIASCLDTSVPAINSALQRARTTLAGRDLGDRGPLTEKQTELVHRYCDAFERYDVDALTALLRDDAILNMPPYTMWLQGPAVIHEWLAGRGSGCRGSRLVPIEASGLPAWGQFRPDPAGGHRAWAILMIELAGDRIARMTSFLDVETLFPHFGLPLVLPSG